MKHLTPDDVAERCERSRRSSGGWMAQCPIHEDRLPSLKISAGKKGTILYCHAGCRTEDVLAALNIDSAMLFYDYDGARYVDTGLAAEFRSLVKAVRGTDMKRPHTLGQLMRVAFTGGSVELQVDRWVRAYVAHGDLMDMPFDPDHDVTWADGEGDWWERGAWNMWSLVADGPVFTYMKDWLKTSGVSWFELKPRAMRQLWDTWRSYA